MKPRQNFVKRRGRKHPTSMKMKSRTLENIKRQRGKYPLLAENIVQMSDIILEIIDLRFPRETRNPEIEEMIAQQNKKIIYVFNKSDLIDMEKIDREYILPLKPCVFVSCVRRKGVSDLRDRIKAAAKQITNPVDRVFNKVSVGVVGYPNTGKSSVINLLAGKTATGVGADAGFTKGIIRVKLTPEIVLFDSPGIIANKEYSGHDLTVMAVHAKVGARSYSQVKKPGVAVALLFREFPNALEKFYEIDAGGDSEVLIEKLGRKKGFLKKRNEVDEDKTARLVLKDWQEGKIRG
jgi:hypothetical protein